MDSNHQKEIAALRNTIEVLEAENAHLSERAEEALLLGLVAETIQSLTDPAEILENELERVSILKNIPHTACGRLVGHELEPIATYASFSDKTGIGYRRRHGPVDPVTTIRPFFYDQGKRSWHVTGSGFVLWDNP